MGKTRTTFTTLQKSHYHKTFFCLFSCTVVTCSYVDEKGGKMNTLFFLITSRRAQKPACRQAGGKFLRSFEKQTAHLLPTFLLTINELSEKVRKRKKCAIPCHCDPHWLFRCSAGHP